MNRSNCFAGSDALMQSAARAASNRGFRNLPLHQPLGMCAYNIHCSWNVWKFFFKSRGHIHRKMLVRNQYDCCLKPRIHCWRSSSDQNDDWIPQVPSTIYVFIRSYFYVAPGAYPITPLLHVDIVGSGPFHLSTALFDIAKAQIVMRCKTTQFDRSVKLIGLLVHILSSWDDHADIPDQQ